MKTLCGCIYKKHLFVGQVLFNTIIGQIVLMGLLFVIPVHLILVEGAAFPLLFLITDLAMCIEYSNNTKKPIYLENCTPTQAWFKFPLFPMAPCLWHFQMYIVTYTLLRSPPFLPQLITFLLHMLSLYLPCYFPITIYFMKLYR